MISKAVGTEPQALPPAEIQRQRLSLHPSERKEKISYLPAYSPNMTSHKSECRSAAKFSLTGYIIMTVSQCESVMDQCINATAVLNDLNIVSNYDFKILLLYKLTV